MKVPHFFQGLRFQLVITLIIVLFVVLSISYFIQLNTLMNILSKQQEKDMLYLFEQVESNINVRLNNFGRIALTLTMDSSVEELFGENITDPVKQVMLKREVHKQIDTLIRTNEGLRAIIIYMDDGAIAGSATPSTYFYMGEEKKHLFYDSAMYKDAIARQPETLWVGGITSEIFLPLHINKRIEQSIDDMIIIGVRYVKIPQLNKNAAVVFAFKESLLRNIYGKYTSGKRSKVMILDKQGAVISSNNIQDYQSKSLYVDEISQNDSGSFRYTKGLDPKLVIYYKIKKTGWTLIKEVPMSIYRDEMRFLRTNIMTTAIVVMGLTLLFYTLWMRRITAPLEHLTNTMRRVGQGDLGMRINMKTKCREIDVLNIQFNQMLENVNNLVHKIEKIEEEKRNLEIESLQAQINPHFIYNTITTIRWMATMIKANNVSNALVSFINVLRPVFNYTGLTWSFAQELEFTENYVKIMNYRFGSSVVIKFNIPEDIDIYETPRFLIQPLVENALLHGFMGSGKGGVTISIKNENNKIQLIVQDDGDGIMQDKIEDINKTINYDNDKVNHTHVGLRNVNRRIKLYYGELYGLSIKSEQGIGTTVTVCIPKKIVHYGTNQKL